MDVLVLNYQPGKYEAWMNGTDVGLRPDEPWCLVGRDDILGKKKKIDKPNHAIDNRDNSSEASEDDDFLGFDEKADNTSQLEVEISDCQNKRNC